MSPKNSKIKVGISCGDPNGIGLEALADALSDERSMSDMIPVVFAPLELAEMTFGDVPWGEVTHVNLACEGRINLVNFEAQDFKYTPGQASKEAGAVAMRSLEMAVAHLDSSELDVLVTAPINKDTIRQAGFPFPGHTEYLASKAEVDEVLMLLCCDGMRIGVVTGHIALKDVVSQLNSDRIMTKLQIMNDSLTRDFDLNSPRIAVLGLNPHAGDNGMLGDEELRIIAPAIRTAQNEGINVHGPIAADGFFGSGAFKNYDGVLAMYHDQGLAPFKALSFGRGVNFTAGLSIIRTSPDHGTGFDIAGQGVANGASFREALHLACKIRHHRINQSHQTSKPI